MILIIIMSAVYLAATSSVLLSKLYRSGDINRYVLHMICIMLSMGFLLAAAIAYIIEHDL